mgnify:CR=1 FL=1
MIMNRRPGVVEDAILLVGDWRWRKGPRWKAALAWLFGRREVLVTHLGDGLGQEVARGPCSLAIAGAEQEILQYGRAQGGVVDFGMELQAEDVLADLQGRHWGIFSIGESG